MGNCSSAKKPVRADPAKAIQTASTLAKNENVNPNLPTTAAIPKEQVNQAKQEINKEVKEIKEIKEEIKKEIKVDEKKEIINELNVIPKLNKYNIKFVTVDDSYYPNKSLSSKISMSPLKRGMDSHKTLNQKFYSKETLLKEVIQNAINDQTRKLKYHTVFRFNGIDLKDKLNSKLEDLIKDSEESKEHIIEIVYGGLKDLPEKIYETIAKNTNFYATINFHKANNKELVVFVKDVTAVNYLKLHKIYNNIFDEETNEIINEHTSYCNALDYYYISGSGDKGFSKSFMRIALNSANDGDLKNKLIQQLADMPIELQLHAMIFVPENYIFVVGGHSSQLERASKKVYYYDIKNNIWDKHSELNYARVHHSLCLVNDNYLFSIFGHKNNGMEDIKNIERINLRGSDRIWEIIKLETFDLSFFNIYGVAQYKNSLILLSVDEQKDTQEIEDNNERNLILNLETNKLSLYSLENAKLIKENKTLPPLTHSKKLIEDNENMDHRLEFLEKSFIPISDNILILSPFNHYKQKTNLIVIKDGIASNESFQHV